MNSQPIRSTVILDANVLLNACFVRESWAALCLEKLAAAGVQTVVSSAIFGEAEKVLRNILQPEFSWSFGLCRQRLSLFKQSAHIANIYVGNSASLGDFPRHDAHILIAVRHTQGTVVTADLSLRNALKQCGQSVLLPLEILNFYDPRAFAVHVFGVRPTPSVGSFFCRATPGGWAGQRQNGRRTLLSVGKGFSLYYDEGHEKWVWRIGHEHEVSVPSQLYGLPTATVAISWKAGQHAIIREGRDNRSASIPLNSSLSARFDGPIHLGSTPQPADHWNGGIQAIIWNDREIGAKVWKQCRGEERLITPNPFDHDRLQESVIRFVLMVAR